MKKIKHILIIVFLIVTFKSVYSHSVQVVYCADCSGTVRVFVEHWHPASEPLLNAAMSFDVTYGTITSSVIKFPIDTIFNVPKNTLPNCLTTPTTFGACSGSANTYNDWLIFEFSGIPANTTFSVVVVAGFDIISSDMCGMLPASTGIILINNSNLQVYDTLTICQGDSILIGGVYQNTPGIYYDSLQTINGCDSIIATTLSLNPTYFNNNNNTICQGDSSLIFGVYQSTSGTYYDSLQTANGCDSIIAITLTVNPTYFSNNNNTICQGDSILIGGVYQNTPGTYYDSLQTINGCDSIIETILTVDTSLTANFTKTLDPNDSLNLLVTNLATGNNLQYLWDFGDGNTSTLAYPSHIYSSIGVYNLCLTVTDSITGCSSMFCDSTTVMRTTGIKTIHVVSSSVGVKDIVKFDKIKLFPNPTQHTFTINLGETQHTQILVTSIEGKMMYNKVITNDNVIIDASKWTNGFYLVNVIIDNQHKVFKLVKQ
jgi:PKD repeat protein